MALKVIKLGMDTKAVVARFVGAFSLCLLAMAPTDGRRLRNSLKRELSRAGWDKLMIYSNAFSSLARRLQGAGMSGIKVRRTSQRLPGRSLG